MDDQQLQGKKNIYIKSASADTEGLRRAADMRYSKHLVIYYQISGRVMDLRFVLSVEVDLITPRLLLTSPSTPIASPGHPDAHVALQPAGAVGLSS